MSPNNLLVVLIITEIFNLVILTVLIAGIKEIVKKQKNELEKLQGYFNAVIERKITNVGIRFRYMFSDVKELKKVSDENRKGLSGLRVQGGKISGIIKGRD